MKKNGLKEFYYENLYLKFVNLLKNYFDDIEAVSFSFDKQDNLLYENIGLEGKHFIVSLKGGAFKTCLKLMLVEDIYRKSEDENRYFTVALKFTIGDIANLTVDFYLDNELNPGIVFHRIKFYPDVIFGDLSYVDKEVSKEDIDFVFEKMVLSIKNLVKNRDKLLSLLLQKARLIDKGEEIEFKEEDIPIGTRSYKFRFALDKRRLSIYVDGVFSESYKSSTNAIEYIAEYVRHKYFRDLTLDKINVFNIVDFFGQWGITRVNFDPVIEERGFFIKRRELIDYNLEFEPIFALDGYEKIAILEKVLN